MPVTTTSKITLTYFDLPARGELSRLIFAIGAVGYEDKRVGFSEFPALQPTLPLGQLPVLDVDGESNLFCQSGAIQRYAAKLSGLYPADPVEALRADTISDSLAELFNRYILIRYHESDDAIQANKFKAFADDTVAKYFGMLEGMVRGKYFGGDNVSFADVHLFDIVHNALNVSLPELSLDAYPKLLAIVAAVESIPSVAAHLKKQ